jgi:hypothetical protein
MLNRKYGRHRFISIIFPSNGYRVTVLIAFLRTELRLVILQQVNDVNLKHSLGHYPLSLLLKYRI